MIVFELEEPDGSEITKKNGTYMFGINGETVEFADIVLNSITPPKDAVAEGGAGPAEEEGAEEEGGMDDDEEASPTMEEEVLAQPVTRIDLTGTC
mmetsp:Transcript_16290/g.13398  ORF Transcript_16290/g.13398 Transcript_16290/m.13398 type:complete len:95 (+) Transcript_16290:2635-2919(+)